MSDIAERVVRRHLDGDHEPDLDAANCVEDEVDRVLVRTEGMLITKPQRFLRRIADRHRRSDVARENQPDENLRVTYGDGGSVSSQDLIRVLDDRFGFVIKLRLRPSLTGLPNTISWEALNERAEVITGKLILHAELRGESELLVWASMIPDP